MSQNNTYKPGDLVKIIKSVNPRYEHIVGMKARVLKYVADVVVYARPFQPAYYITLESNDGKPFGTVGALHEELELVLSKDGN